jgi:hypothetical protein
LGVPLAETACELMFQVIAVKLNEQPISAKIKADCCARNTWMPLRP